MVYYAHYDRKNDIRQKLSEHLHAVARYGELTLPPTVVFPGLQPTDIKKLCRIVTLIHDLGKYTSYFQNYLVQGNSSEFKSHAHISGCFARLLALNELSHLPDPHLRQAWAFLAYLCVRFHHGNLTLKHLFQENIWNVLEKQHADLKRNWESVLVDLGLHNDPGFADLVEQLDLRQWRSDEKHFIFMPQHLAGGRLRRDYWFFAVQFFFSKLIDSDKLDSGGVTGKAELEIQTVSSERVQAHIQHKHADDTDKSMTERRQKARMQMRSVLCRMTNEQLRQERIFTITAPTGIGKTLASLECALYLQERIRHMEGYTPRIIVAIPFINIIEQTRKDYEHVFGGDARVLVHHRLADLSIAQNKVEHSEELPMEQRLILTESWEADVVLTTFVQLFHSIFTNRNRLLKKYHKLAGSIVILDEVQSIPDKYMPLIGAVIRKFASYYGTRFILMTATQPKVLELGDRLLQQPYVQPVELLPDHEQYFSDLRRTKLIPLLERRLKTSNFIQLFLETMLPSQSALIVVNTIRRSIEIYERLIQAKRDGLLPDTTEIYYLSTNIVPRQRREVIDEVEKRLKSPVRNSVILVSTQTIEAGVDLDFDVGYRDLAPLESIIQTAGRINRRGEKGEYCPLYVCRLDSDAQYVYDLHHLNRTTEILKKFSEINEPHFGKLMKKYYGRLAEELPFDESRKLWQEGIVRLDYELLSEFQLIDTSDVADVYVELNDEATRLADEYKRLMADREMMRYSKRSRLRQVMAAMSDYMIQVRINRLKSNRPPEFSVRNDVEDQMFWIPPGQINEFYDSNTGFKDEHKGAFLY
jgi:CRISPR-associated endonuclease/helicase Cas3